MVHKGKKRLKVIGVLQVRMASTRLPGKATKKILGKTMTEWIIERMKAAKELDGVVMSITDEPEDDVLVRMAQKNKIPYYRGIQREFIDAFYTPLKQHYADAVVRITGDCPLVDPNIIDTLVKVYRKNPSTYDYLSNIFPPTFPHGLDVEVFPRRVFERLEKLIKDKMYRELFNVYIKEHPKKFKIFNLKDKKDNTWLRVTVDYPEDFKLVKRIYKELVPKRRIFTTKQVLQLIKQKSRLLAINANRLDTKVVGGIRTSAYTNQRITNKKI